MSTLAAPDLASPAFFADRYPTYRELRDSCPAFDFEIDGEPCIVFTRYADVDELLRHPAVTVQPEPGKFPERVGHGPASVHYRESLPSMDPPEHTRIRKIATPAYTPRAVAKMRGWMDEVLESHLSRLGEHSGVDFINAFCHPVSAEIACRLMHVPLADAEDLISRSAPVLAVLGVTSLSDGALAESDAAARYYQDYMNDLLNTLRGKELPTDNIVGALLAAEGKENGVTRSEIITTMVGFIIATFHTTKAMMANATLALLHHPIQRARLMTQPELAGSAWEEALRYDGAIHFMHRYASRPLTINDIGVEPGHRLLLGLQAANRDERRFADPDSFIIDRPSNRHLGFAAGPHFCLGAQLARLEGELLLERLFRRFPHMSLSSVERPAVTDLSFPMLTRLNVSLR